MHCQIGLFVVGVCLLSRGQGSEVGGGYRRTKKAGEHMFGKGAFVYFKDSRRLMADRPHLQNVRASLS